MGCYLVKVTALFINTIIQFFDRSVTVWMGVIISRIIKAIYMCWKFGEKRYLYSPRLTFKFQCVYCRNNRNGSCFLCAIKTDCRITVSEGMSLYECFRSQYNHLVITFLTCLGVIDNCLEILHKSCWDCYSECD